MASHRSFRLSRFGPEVLTSGATSIYKRWFPRVWCGGMMCAIVMGVFRIVYRGHFAIEDLPAVGGAVFLLTAGYLLYPKALRDLVDEVVDDGDALIVRNDDTETRVSLANIAAVLDSSIPQPHFIRLSIDPPCPFGPEITFMPRYRFAWNGLHPLVGKLRARVESARQGPPSTDAPTAEPSDGAESR